MWMITLRDLQFRRRQFAIAVIGAAVAFALALVLTGMSAGFRREARDTVAAIHAGAWVVPRGVTGPFTSESTMPTDLARRISGGGQVEPLVNFVHNARVPGGERVSIGVIGHSIGALGDPVWGHGPVILPHGQAVVDARLGVKRGETIRIGSQAFLVARVVHDRTLPGNRPVVFMSLQAAQQIAFNGRPVATAFVTRRMPRQVPPGYTVRTNDQVRADLLKPLSGAFGSIDVTRLLTWIMAIVVIGAVTYLSALERLRDFAVLKAVGGSPRRLVIGLGAQAVLAAVLAALLGAVLAQLLGPVFPARIVIDPSAYVVLAVVAVLVGVLASFAAMRRVTRVDPALAFSG